MEYNCKHRDRAPPHTLHPQGCRSPPQSLHSGNAGELIRLRTCLAAVASHRLRTWQKHFYFY